MGKECLGPVEPGIMACSKERDNVCVGQHAKQGVRAITNNIRPGSPQHEGGYSNTRELFESRPLPKAGVDSAARRGTALPQPGGYAAVDVRRLSRSGCRIQRGLVEQPRFDRVLACQRPGISSFKVLSLGCLNRFPSR
jgi:hypothetical protein